ncbi:chlorophyll A-B-binding protein [Chroogloeocystis siderophila]|uniref:Chlorophyll A-B-binding protein n=1 Tax=Chroogloeocystis siderophila 5.2 s.c.1 TaxID=247279 RepID=A0A1U7HDA1_9CHRO|nr:chlorophyll A-B-binding protein [Chroogloeocystis siderophila]OKH21521.1 chlorophyll A-B-binding protein [Chroogloeocystis siderophila 5.2 s.c.1]
MQTSSKNKVKHPWWAGNARFINLSGTFLVAHIAHAAIVCFGVGAWILWEIARYSPTQPMYEQKLFWLPRLATQGWGVLNNQAIDTQPYFRIAVVLIISSLVFAVGTWFHRTKVAESLEEEKLLARRYHFSWDDPKKLGLILGNHLIFLGLGALLVAAKAMFFGGLYDANLGAVRVVTNPTLNPLVISDRILHLFTVNNLEDVVGGHIYAGVLLIVGGIWHLSREPFDWVKRRFIFSGNAILGYSLFALSLVGFAGAFYCGFNTLVYPEEFYGVRSQFNLFLLPHFYIPGDPEPTSRIWLANAYFYLAFVVLQGSIWHFGLAASYFEPVLESWKNAFSEILPNPNLAYQKHFNYQPQSNLDTFYETPIIKQKPAFAYQQPANDNLYNPSRPNGKPSFINPQQNQKVLYEFSYPKNHSNSFYESPAEDQSNVNYPHSIPRKLYETTYPTRTSTHGKTFGYRYGA